MRGCQHKRGRGGGAARDGEGHGGSAPPSGNSTLAPAPFSDLSPSRYTQRGRESTRSHEHTHKYCLFLACLTAARVWSLLKSPESDSKMSSIRIPALALHMSRIIVRMHATVLRADVFRRRLKLLTSSGSAQRSTVIPGVRAAIGTDALAENSTGGKGDEPCLNRGSQKCYMYGQV